MLKHIVIAVLMLVACATTGVQANTYTIDGHISDWGVTLRTYNWTSHGHSERSFVQSSFRPSHLGSKDYKVEDYSISDTKPKGGEYYDYEAAYFDDSATMLYVGIISSHPWDAALDVFRVTANGITINAPQFDQFAWSNLGIDEIVDGVHYPNYFYEGAISVSRFGQLPSGSLVTIYANCCIYTPPPDSITLCADKDSCSPPPPPPGQCVPEPATISLMGLALTGLAGYGWRRRRTA